MRISTIGYVGKQGIKNIWRNKMFSLASVATMSACIFLFGLFFSILVNSSISSGRRNKVLRSLFSLKRMQQRSRNSRSESSLKRMTVWRM